MAGATVFLESRCLLGGAAAGYLREPEFHTASISAKRLDSRSCCQFPFAQAFRRNCRAFSEDSFHFGYQRPSRRKGIYSSGLRSSKLQTSPNLSAISDDRKLTEGFPFEHSEECCKSCGDEGVPPAAPSGRSEQSEGLLAGFFKAHILAKAILLFSVGVILRQPSAAFATVAAAAPVSAATQGLLGTRGSEVLISAWTGLVAGCLHTLTGPDHLAALAPLAIGKTWMESAAIGGLWGCGHDAGQVLFGILFVLLKDKLHLPVLQTWGTRIVGITLLAIGAIGIQEAQQAAMEAPVTSLSGLGGNDASETFIEQQADGSAALSTASGSKNKFGLATFCTGVVHGLQPDALLIILPALALPSKLAGAAFLSMFLLGTVVAMASYTVFIVSCSDALQKRIPGFTQRLSYAAAFLAIGFGVLILAGGFFGIALF